jgi:hypothetical protein
MVPPVKLKVLLMKTTCTFAEPLRMPPPVTAKVVLTSKR